MYADARIATMRRNTAYDVAQLESAYAGRTWEHYRPLLAELIEFAPPGRVLDVGAGTGLFAQCCRNFGLRCFALEGAPETARLLRRRGLPAVAARLESGLPFGDQSFHAVSCSQVVEHLLPETAALLFREALRVLAPGGVILIQSPSPRDRKQREEPEHINLYLPSRLRRDVVAAGFEILAERNGPIEPLGKGRLRTLLFRALLQLGSTDLLSATANVVGRKPL